MTSYGHIDKFRTEDESVKAYLEQIDIYRIRGLFGGDFNLAVR